MVGFVFEECVWDELIYVWIKVKRWSYRYSGFGDGRKKVAWSGVARKQQMVTFQHNALTLTACILLNFCISLLVFSLD